MTKQFNVLFIDGPWDGHRLVLSDMPPTYRVPIMSRPPSIGYGLSDPFAYVEAVRFDEATYRRETYYDALGEPKCVYICTRDPSQLVAYDIATLRQRLYAAEDRAERAERKVKAVKEVVTK